MMNLVLSLKTINNQIGITMNIIFIVLTAMLVSGCYTKQDTTYNLHGVEIVDNYLWMKTASQRGCKRG